MTIEAGHPQTNPRPGERSTVGALMHPATTIESRAHLAGAAYVMKRRRVGVLVVITDDQRPRPFSVVTEADISSAIADGHDPERTRIQELWSAPPVTIDSATSVDDAARTMGSLRVQHLPVVDAGRLVGVVDLPDLDRALDRHRHGEVA